VSRIFQNLQTPLDGNRGEERVGRIEKPVEMNRTREQHEEREGDRDDDGVRRNERKAVRRAACERTDQCTDKRQIGERVGVGRGASGEATDGKNRKIRNRRYECAQRH